MIEVTYIDYIQIDIIKSLYFFQNRITHTGSLRNVGLREFGT